MHHERHDPIADMLTRMRNASRIKRREVQMPSSKLKIEIAKILKEEGYIKNYKVLDDRPQGILTVTLKYTEANQSVITGSRRVSKPGCRIYCTRDARPQGPRRAGRGHHLHLRGCRHRQASARSWGWAARSSAPSGEAEGKGFTPCRE